MTAAADRRALRRSDPAALATILVGQLTAYRCSTIYAPSVTKLDAFVREEALPRLRARLDVRTVIVERWAKRTGPTVAELIDEVLRQLELDPGDPDQKPLAALESALQRAERHSDRPILLVLYRLEQLLDARRDPAEVARFVAALDRIAALAMPGLHLVLGVQEEDLGAFRDLLRGRWRLLANDIRIKPSGKKWLMSVPLIAGVWIGSNSVTVAVAGTVCVSAGAATGTVVAEKVCEPAKEALAACEVETGRLRRASRPKDEPPPPLEPATDPIPQPVVDATTGDATTGDATTGNATTGDATTGEFTTALTTDTSGLFAVPTPAVLIKTDICAPVKTDNQCGTCVRASCCADLQACKKPKWRACVLKGRIGQAECLPETIEAECRGLALCALEKTCRPDCFPG